MGEISLTTIKGFHKEAKTPITYLHLLCVNLYRLMAKELPGFENCTASTLSRKFLENGATIKIKGDEVTVHIKKKTHLPILFEAFWMRQTTQLSWMGLNPNFVF